jgi:hypothetical protein
MSYHEQVHVIRHDLQRHHQPPAAPAGLRADQPLTAAPDPTSQNRAPVNRAPHDVIPQIADATSGNLHVPGHARDYTHPPCQTARFPRRPNTAAPSRGA